MSESVEGLNGADWSHFFLTGWPFQTVPDETFAGIWADRTAVKEAIDRLVFRWSRQDASTIHLMWADLGAGKTHTLRHIQKRCAEREELRIWALYAVMPKSMKTFVEVYQAILSTWDMEALAGMFDAAFPTVPAKREAAHQLFPSIPDAATALQTLTGSDVQKSVAGEWLRGSKLTNARLNAIGVTRYIKTSDDAVAVLTGLMQILHASSRRRRVVVMLDECQRLSKFRPSIGQDISAGLQTWYDACPNYFTLLMSFGSGEEKFVKHLVSEELQSRADRAISLRLELLSKNDSIDFIAGLLEAFREPGAPSEWFPFSEDGVKRVIDEIVDTRGITPRELMAAFGALLSEADYRHGMGKPIDFDSQEATKLATDAIAALDSEAD